MAPIIITDIASILDALYCSENITHFISCNPYNNPMRLSIIITPILYMKGAETQRSQKCMKVAELGLEPRQSSCKACCALLPLHTEDETEAFNT